MRPPILLAILGLLLAGCSVGRLDAETPRETRVELVRFQHALSFQPGATHLSLREAKALADFLRRHEAGYGDQALLIAPASAADNEFLLEAREEAVEQALARQGLRLAGTGLTAEAKPGADGFLIVLQRHVAQPPSCPGYNRSLFDESAARSLNILGCANAANLGLMVANPADLTRGRPPGPADGTFSARQIDRYRTGETSKLGPRTGTTSEGSGGR